MIDINRRSKHFEAGQRVGAAISLVLQWAFYVVVFAASAKVLWP